jgi:hypothetical protein
VPEVALESRAGLQRLVSAVSTVRQVERHQPDVVLVLGGQYPSAIAILRAHGLQRPAGLHTLEEAQGRWLLERVGEPGGRSHRRKRSAGV